jgi:hypothetical protein
VIDTVFLATLGQFNPAKGTLTSVMLSLTGSATWSSGDASPSLTAKGQVQGFQTFGSQSFSNPGTITFTTVSGSSSDSGLLSSITGTGTMQAGIDFTTSDTTDNMADIGNGLSGVLTYTFTAPTPEPASLTLFGLGAVGLIGYGWRKRKRMTA